jgi:hypothetical protein
MTVDPQQAQGIVMLDHLRKWLKPAPRVRARPSPRKARLWLEPLEERTLPSVAGVVEIVYGGQSKAAFFTTDATLAVQQLAAVQTVPAQSAPVAVLITGDLNLAVASTVQFSLAVEQDVHLGAVPAQSAPAAPAGNTLVASTVTNPAGRTSAVLKRTSSSGAVDPTFGAGGASSVSIPAGSDALGLAIQTDGKILLAALSSGATAITVARFDSNGNPDLSFALNGVLNLRLTPVGGGATSSQTTADGVVVSMDASGVDISVNATEGHIFIPALAFFGQSNGMVSNACQPALSCSIWQIPWFQPVNSSVPATYAVSPIAAHMMPLTESSIRPRGGLPSAALIAWYHSEQENATPAPSPPTTLPAYLEVEPFNPAAPGLEAAAPLDRAELFTSTLADSSALEPGEAHLLPTTRESRHGRTEVQEVAALLQGQSLGSAQGGAGRTEVQQVAAWLPLYLLSEGLPRAKSPDRREAEAIGASGGETPGATRLPLAARQSALGNEAPGSRLAAEAPGSDLAAIDAAFAFLGPAMRQDKGNEKASAPPPVGAAREEEKPGGSRLSWRSWLVLLVIASGGGSVWLSRGPLTGFLQSPFKREEGEAPG